MCGIFGAIHKTGSFHGLQDATFRSLTDMVRYRGPDDFGYVALNTSGVVRAGEPFRAFLGHRRLSIIDLSSAGHQPMTDGSGLWLVFNGEIFNYIELREELKREGHRFSTATDSEVILALYARHGERGFSRMNGMWALALVDIPRRRVVLSRDRFSIKPLYVYDSDECLFVASEIKQLLPMLPSIQPNRAMIGAFLDQSLFDHTAETFYERIHRIPPASSMVLNLDSGCASTERYWAWPEADSIVSAEQAVEIFRALLMDSVRLRLRSDVKVGTLLSGGLDSSALAMLSNVDTDPTGTYSVVSDSDCSEERFIDLVNARLRCPSKKIRVEAKSSIESLQEVLFHQDEPLGGLNVIAQFQLMQTIRRESDCTVLLSGQGGDEVLLGYLKYFFFAVRELAAGKSYGKALAQLAGAFVNRTVLHQFDFGKARRYSRSSRQRDFLISGSGRTALWRTSSVRDRQIADVEHYSVPALTHYEDRSSMAFGLEVRHPFLDHRLVEFAVNLPTCAKLRNGWPKYLLRRAIPELPDEIRWRRDKQGFVLPERQWLMNDFASTIRDVMRNSILAELSLLDSAKFLGFYDRFARGQTSVWHNEITRVLMAELWARRFLTDQMNTEKLVAALN